RVSTASASLLPSDRFLYSFIAAAPTARSPLSLHDALPISLLPVQVRDRGVVDATVVRRVLPEHALDPAARLRERRLDAERQTVRSEEHTSELQSRENLVCRLLLEKKKSHNVTSHDTNLIKP